MIKVRQFVVALAKVFGADRSGGVVVTFAVALPVLLAAAGLASDYAMMTKIRSDLQHAADAAATAAAHEIPLAHNNALIIKNAAKSYAAFALENSGTDVDLISMGGKSNQTLTVSSEVVDNFTAIKVTVQEDWTPFFAHFLSSQITPVVVTATARYVGSNNICVLGLAPAGQGVFLDTGSRLTGNNCGVFSNSGDSSSLTVRSSATLVSQINCSSGGTDVSAGASISPAAITDCPVIDDPLANRPPPPVGACTDNNLIIKAISVTTLNPGVYCGGITIKNNAQVTLTPGIYVMLDGALKVSGTATLNGDGAGIFITGANPQPFEFAGTSHINMTAPIAGPMAGLLFYEDRAMTQHLTHKITSDDAHKLIGTIYLPRGDLLIDSGQKVADQSAFTAIVVNHLQLNAGPNLVLNSDYTSTNVPVPPGIRGTQQIILTQ